MVFIEPINHFGIPLGTLIKLTRQGDYLVIIWSQYIAIPLVSKEQVMIDRVGKFLGEYRIDEGTPWLDISPRGNHGLLKKI